MHKTQSSAKRLDVASQPEPDDLTPPFDSRDRLIVAQALRIQELEDELKLLKEHNTTTPPSAHSK